MSTKITVSDLKAKLKMRFPDPTPLEVKFDHSLTADLEQTWHEFKVAEKRRIDSKERFGNAVCEIIKSNPKGFLSIFKHAEITHNGGKDGYSVEMTGGTLGCLNITYFQLGDAFITIKTPSGHTDSVFVPDIIRKLVSDLYRDTFSK